MIFVLTVLDSYSKSDCNKKQDYTGFQEKTGNVIGLDRSFAVLAFGNESETAVGNPA